MAGDELNAPLGKGRRVAQSGRGRIALLGALGVGALTLASLLVVMVVSANPHGGEPYAIAAIVQPAPTKPAATPAAEDRATAATRQTPAAANETRVVENGVTVVRSAHGESKPGSQPGALVIKVPEALGQSEVLPVDKRLIEQTRYGPLPRIGPDGLRASELYARPLVFTGPIRPGTPRIALAIGGLESGATDGATLSRLPAAISLAFSPFGEHMDNVVARAKATGHEVLLQLPMDDGSSAPPRPRVLAASASATETVDTLHWLMSRMGGYVGVIGGSGAAFSADKAAMTTMLDEIGSRGLLYLDEGTSQRSVGPTLAASLGVASGRADVIIDPKADPAALRVALTRLEAVAREKGSAIGLATGLPNNLAAIIQFVDALEGKGLVLVPVSALATGVGRQPVAESP